MGINMYIFKSDSQTSQYMVLESNDTVFASAYLQDAIRVNALTGFEKFSQECITYMTGKTPIYSGDINLGLFETTEFNNHQEFVSFYAANKAEIESSTEEWVTPAEIVSSTFSSPEEINDPFQSSLVYIDKTRSPEGLFGKKAISKALFHKVK